MMVSRYGKTLKSKPGAVFQRTLTPSATQPKGREMWFISVLGWFKVFRRGVVVDIHVGIPARASPQALVAVLFSCPYPVPSFPLE